MLIENKRKIAFLIFLLSPSLAPRSFFNHLDPSLCRKALALKVSPTSNGEPICSELWFYHTSQLGSVPFLGQPAIPHVAVRRLAPLRPITHPHISTPLAHFRRDVSAISNNHFNSSRVELSIRTFTRNNIACVFAEFGNADQISTFLRSPCEICNESGATQKG
jgi:hypothetical protein